MQKAAQDRSAIVRRVAGNVLFQEIGDDIQVNDLVAIAEQLSRDVSPSVAERGKFALKKFQ
ncbi:hypothetical protein [[Leptolyngbya] sp. PCC 7376]|uniref:hypothetical protein n=1 Tax=[Leptolyngbya] sp. PCC 7376 TaxID=111781 RepID=UPI000304C501|nr:hypothetical protein [[Leptolyngbya] sp. PCC 7376]